MFLKISKQKIYFFLEYCLAMVLILDINCVWIRKYELGDDFFTYITLIIEVLVFLFEGVNIKRKDLIPLSLLNVFVLISGATHGIGIKSLVLIGIPFSLSYLLIRHFSYVNHDIIGKITNLVTIIAAISLVFYFFGSILGVIPGKTISSFHWGYDVEANSYFDIYYESQGAMKMFSNAEYVRNCALFCEAPMYAFLLAICFGYELLIREKRNTVKLTVLFITCITTTSSTGIVGLFMTLLFFSIIKFRDKKTNKTIRIILLLSLPTIFVTCISICYYMFVAKMTIRSLSYSTRMDDLRACFQVFLSSPLWGCGVRYYNSIISHLSMINRSSTGMSSGLFVMLAQTGVALVIWPIIKVLRCKYSIKEYCYFMLFIFLFMFTNIPYKCIIIFILYPILLNNRNNKGSFQ